MNLMQLAGSGLVVLLLLGSPLPAVRAQDKAEPKPAAPARSREAVEKEFSARLSGSSLVGHFTLDGDASEKALKEDRYQIAAVSKVRDDHWLFVYVHKNVPIPLTLKVLWAGETPVLTLDDFTIPGMGTFSARVMFHGNRYAGTWQHGEKGGLMFGRVESAAKPAAPAAGSAGDAGQSGQPESPKPDNPKK